MILPPRTAVDHAPGRAQAWGQVDPDLGDWVLGVTGALEHVLDSQLTAIYLHGSLAMGSYYRPKSDVDLLVVIDGILQDSDRRECAARLLRAFDRRPTVGGLEVSVVQRRHVWEFEHPLPFEFHFSEQWAEDVRHGRLGPRGRDPDLAAHCTVTRSRGIAIRGRPAEEVLGPVPHGAFVDSIVEDLRWIVLEEGIQESPFYGVLNICRVLHVLAGGPGLVPSKEEGGLWALDNLPQEYRTVIEEALECYRSAAEVSADQRLTHGHAWDHEALASLSAYSATVGLDDEHRRAR